MKSPFQRIDFSKNFRCVKHLSGYRLTSNIFETFADHACVSEPGRRD
jgi:hypothetical protein